MSNIGYARFNKPQQEETTLKPRIDVYINGKFVGTTDRLDTEFEPAYDYEDLNHAYLTNNKVKLKFNLSKPPMSPTFTCRRKSNSKIQGTAFVCNKPLDHEGEHAAEITWT